MNTALTMTHPVHFALVLMNYTTFYETKEMAGHLPSDRKKGDQEYAFQKVQLLKNETLGTGSYGAVCKAKCDQLICAAKLLYPVLFQMIAPDPGKEHRQPFRRFEQECQFLSRINHPNIVQYLGTYRDPETNAPVLLMELMDESLTHFLESSSEDIPYHIQVNLSHDIVQALAFLHANGIIHRDLSSNNVLLIAGSRGKVSDFGMSKFTNISKTRLATMTQCPGTPAYMSPEALNEPPVYTEKLDTFSVGVLLVQIITREFPDPTDRFKTMQFPNPQNPSHNIEALVLIPEIERRQSHITLIEPTHALLPIAMGCLKDKDAERPSSQELCQSLNVLKATAKYNQSQSQSTAQLSKANDQQMHEQIRAKDQELQKYSRNLKSKETEIGELEARLEQAQQVIQDRDTEIRQLRDELEQAQRDRQENLTLNGELMRLNQQLQFNLEISAQKDGEIAELRQSVSKPSNPFSQTDDNILDPFSQIFDPFSQQDTPQQPQSQVIPTQNQLQSQATPTSRTSHGMSWSIHDSPIAIIAGSSTDIGSKAYFVSRFLSDLKSPVYEFNSSNSLWRELPPHPLTAYTIVTVNSKLTTVGGGFENWLGNDKYSNQLYSFIDGKWAKHFPSMSKKRESPGAASTSNTLVVAGGSNDNGQVDTVEIMDIRFKQWSTVCSLPFTTWQPSITICGQYVYLHPRKQHQTIVKCSLGELTYSRQKSNKWENICSLPADMSTLVTVNDRLLAVGGKAPRKQSVYMKEIHEYNQATDSWEVISEMIEARCNCLTALLPRNKLMVVGGTSKSDYKLEIGSFL